MQSKPYVGKQRVLPPKVNLAAAATIVTMAEEFLGHDRHYRKQHFHNNQPNHPSLCRSSPSHQKVET
ncbi:hypothetical protein Pcinc_007091 [Petrolisthes cinctipes]|uniref:Uncharacterized protein n=1 Tax=Petrolisthes cinctipes TaxID=88211 RepID=A0AAE1KYW7_PETCI|nr:hypothetical protein Pcinc_007091 [Petrolisthes cinctipes]